jgi:hypothetical protein
VVTPKSLEVVVPSKPTVTFAYLISAVGEGELLFFLLPTVKDAPPEAEVIFLKVAAILTEELAVSPLISNLFIE